MKILTKTLLFTLILIQLASAQTFRGLQEGISALQLRIDNLERTATRYNAPRILDALDKASQKLQEARDVIRQSPFKITEAWALYLQAKKLTDAAAKLLLLKPVIQAVTKLDNAIRKAETEIQNSDNTEARYLLNRARSYRVKAVTAYEINQFEKAQEFHRIALYFAEKSYELATGDENSVDAITRYQQAMENLNQLYNDLALSNTENSALKNLIQNAALAMKQARTAYEQGKRVKALAHLQIAERLLYRAADLNEQSESGKKENIEDNLFSLEQYINSIEQNFTENSSAGDRRLLNKARAFLNAARRDYENNAYKQAESKIALAQRMATKALHFDNSLHDQDQNQIEQRIQELEQLITLQKSKINPQNQNLVNFLHTKVSNQLHLAKQNAEAAQLIVASNKINLSMRLLNRVESILNRNLNDAPDINRINQRANQLQTTLNKISSSTENNESASIIIPLLNEILAKVPQSVAEGDLAMAEELLNIVDRQLGVLLKSTIN